jgi:hypothetical protein
VNGRARAARHGRRRPRWGRDRAAIRVTRLRAVVAFVVVLGLAQILFEDLLLFLATAGGGVSGVLASPLVAIAVPLTIATLLLVVLVGGALWSEDRLGAGAIERPGTDAEEDDREW